MRSDHYFGARKRKSVLSVALEFLFGLAVVAAVVFMAVWLSPPEFSRGFAYALF